MIEVNTLHDARILIVDDEPANVRLLERTLQSEGYRSVQCTTDSSEVIALVERFQPDLVLLDLHMPAPDGFAGSCYTLRPNPSAGRVRRFICGSCGR